MKLEQQVTSLYLSKRLKELGMKQESLFYWIDIFPCFNDEVRIEPKDSMEAHLEHCGLSDLAKGLAKDKCYSAFTVAELGEIMKDVDIAMPKYWGGNWEFEDTNTEKFIFSDTEANARARMMIYLIENELLKL